MVWSSDEGENTTWGIDPEADLLKVTHEEYGDRQSFIQRVSTGNLLAVNQDIHMFLQVGQSLALGGGSNQVVEIGILYPEYCQMLSDGPKSFGHFDLFEAWLPEDITAYAAERLATEVLDFVPAAELSGISRGETVGRGLMDIAHAAHAKDGSPPAYVFRACGNPGAWIGDIEKGTPPYLISLEEVRHAKNLAALYGKNLILAGLIITHGEADRNWAGYEGRLVQFIADYRADLIAITGQTAPVRVFIDQTAAPYLTPPLTALTQTLVQEIQLKVASETADCYLSTPKYHLPYLLDEVHLTGLGYRLLGEHIGNAYSYINRFGVDWKPVAPTTIVRSGNVVTVTFDVVFPPLVLDTTTLPAVAQSGFTFYDDAVEIAITDVQVVTNVSVQLTLASTPTSANQRLWYVEGGNTYAWGNLRDSMVKKSIVDPAYTIRNWAAMFNRAVYTPSEADILLISSLKGWVNAGAGNWSIGGGGELILHDLSTAAANFSNAAGVTVNPTITPAALNGYPVITFAGVGSGNGGLQRSVSDLPNTTGAATFVVVARRNTLDSTRMYTLASGIRTAGFVLEYTNNNTQLATIGNGSTLLSTEDPTLWEVWFGSYNNDALTIRQYTKTNGHQSAALSAVITTPEIFLGQNSTGFQGLIGDVAEALIFYDDLLDPANVADFDTVYTFLTSKYGL